MTRPPALSSRARVAGAVACVLLALAPFAAVLVVTLDQWHSLRAIGDQALVELSARDVGSRAVLLGPYSRYGFYHPGPLLFYVLAVPYRLLGASLVALPVGALAVNVASVVVSGWLAWRRGGAVLLALTMLGVVLLLGGLGGESLRQVWNPTITILPLVAFVLLTWSAWEGDRWALPVAVAIGSFEVQSHVGYAAIVGLLSLWALAGTIASARSGRRPLAATLWTTVAVLGVLWALPVVEQVTHDPGNLDAVLEFARDPAGPHQSLQSGWNVVALALSRHAPWITGTPWRNLFTGEVVAGDGPAVPVAVGVLVAGAALAVWQRAWAATRLALTVGIALTAATFSFARLSGPMYTYIVEWVWAVAMLTWVAALWCVWSAWAAWWERRTATRDATRGAATLVARVRRVVAVGLGAGLVVASVAVTADVSSFSILADDQVAATRHLSHAARDALGDEADERGPVVVEAADDLVSRSIAAGVALELARHDIDFVVPPSYRLAFGGRRVEHRGEAGPRLYVGPPDSAVVAPGAGGTPSPWRELARSSLRRPLPVVVPRPQVGIYLREGPAGPVAGAE